MKWIVLLYSLLGICCICGCGNYTTQNQTGGASETINATVIVQDSSLFVNVKARDTVFADVRLLGADYNPIKNKGYYDSAFELSSDVGIKITAISGKYICIIKDRITAKSLLVCGLEFGAGLSDTIFDSLAVCGSIKGNVTVSQIDSSSRSSVKVFLLGTFFQTEVDTFGEFNLNAIPAGFYSIIATIENDKKSDRFPDRTVGREIHVKIGEILTGTTLFFSN